MRNQRKHEVLISMLMACGIAACNANAAGSGVKACDPGAVTSCGCIGDPARTTTCLPDGTGYQPCSCGAGSAAGQGGSASTVPGTSGQPALGSGGMMAQPGSAGSSSPSAAGRSGSSGGSAGMSVAGRSGGAGMNAAGVGGSSGATGASGSAASSETDMLRDVCVAEINMYRAMLTGVMPLVRASAAQEMCSDQGAQVDGDSMIGHGFFSTAGSCIQKVGLSAQDTCPGYPVGGFGGAATVADALKACLKGMWGEGEPPQGRAACMSDSSCFQKYGHYLNMSNPKATAASCAFYKMKDGMSWWMNQDFVVTWP